MNVRALSRCLLSLSQKLKEPSEPAVTNVPYLRETHIRALLAQNRI